jgi:hypothetical protein
MGTLNAFYVRGGNDAVKAAIQKEFPKGEIEIGGDFMGVTLNPEAFEPPESVLAEFSAAFGTEVIWLSFQSVVDAFQFYRWNAGTLTRALVFGCFGDEERTWDRVDGTPEPWERAAMFSARGLESALEFLAHTEAEKIEFERIWRESELLPGRSEPSIDGRETARAVATHYHLRLIEGH